MPRSDRLEARGVVRLLARGPRRLMEDALLSDRERGLFAVADGFGGEAGSKASRIACEAVKGFLSKEAGDLDATLPFMLKRYHSLAGNVLYNALTHANSVVTKANHAGKAGARGGASVIAAFVEGDTVAIAGVGACSTWLFREGRAIEILGGKTYSKLVDPFQLDGHPSLAAPLRSLGTAPDVEPEIVETRLQVGDWLLLASDGVGAAFRDGLMGGVLGLPPLEAAERASSLFREVPLKENAAALLVRF